MPSMSKLGIGLGVAQLLRVGQDLGELAPALAHLGQDVVAGAVQDAGDGADAVAGQALAQRLDHRDAAGHRRLERQRHAAFLRRTRQFGAMHRQQRLVRGDQRLAGADRGLGQRPRRPVRAADQLDHHVHRRVGRQRHRILVPAQAGDRKRRDPSTGRAPKPRVTAIGRPARAATISALSRSIFSTPPPTVPRPARATDRGRVMARPPRTAPVRRHCDSGLQEAADVADRLAQPVGVLHQRDAHVALAVLAEAQAGRHRDLGPLQQQLGELDAAQRGISRRHRRPGEHRPLRARHVPAGRGQAA